MKKRISYVFLVILLIGLYGCADRTGQPQVNSLISKPSDTEKSNEITNKPTNNSTSAPSNTENSNEITNKPINNSISVPRDTKNGNEIRFSNGYFTDEDIKQLVTLKKKQIENILGKEDKKALTAGEDSEYSYEYIKNDIRIYYEFDESISYIECGQNVVIKGAHARMNFDQVEQALGKGKRTTLQNEEDTEFILTYIFEECTYRFLSDEEDGDGSYLTVFNSVREY